MIMPILLIIHIYIFSNLEKLFGNFEKQKSPFTNANTKIILAIAKYLLATKIITILMSFITTSTIRLESITLIELLVVYAIYYVFKYATGMQKMVDTKIYD